MMRLRERQGADPLALAAARGAEDRSLDQADTNLTKFRLVNQQTVDAVLQSEDAVVAAAVVRSCGSVCNKQPNTPSY